MGSILITSKDGGVPAAHASTHEQGGADEVLAENLASNLSAGALLSSDGSGLEDSGISVETAPTGGSGIRVAEYASAPATPPTGLLWIERVDATTVRWNYFDGTDTYSVDMTS